tara:strand:- start:1359 stop:3554 length:2196 start_codon:yes stop_codon:yes gene_type:complete
MPINIEIKGNLARLLATEDIIIEHKNVETASFDVKKRLLILPMWEKASEVVYDMLVAHEVGHALFTPDRLWITEDAYRHVPHGYVNVVEDARIERKIKQRYRGLNRDFHQAYSELNDSDLFEVEGKNIDWMKPIDKINLYFKIGNFVDINFTDEEEEFITRMTKADTFDEVLDISKDIHAYTKELSETMKESMDANSDDESSEGDNEQVEYRPAPNNSKEESEDSEETDTEGGEFGEENDIEEGESGEPTNTKAGEFGNIDVSNTQEQFDRNVEDLCNEQDKHYNNDNVYLTLPDMNLDNVIIDFNTIKKYLDNHFTEAITEDWSKERYASSCNEYKEFKRSVTKEVNYLVKEFEMKKSADSYARQATARTGVLDTSKLHTYLYNEDIFKKITTVPDGKNHGLVFLLDWSGSMQHILKDTIKQLFQLVWFCKKVQIPFEVYAFSNDAWSIGAEDVTYREIKDQDLITKWTENDINVQGHFRLVNVLSSKAKTKELDQQLLNIWNTVASFVDYNMPYPRGFSLSGTPLNEAIVCTRQLVERMTKSNGLQKCHVIILTDGEGQHSSYNVDRTDTNSYYGYDLDKHGTRSIGYNAIIRNRKTGRTFANSYSRGGFTMKLIEAVKDSLGQDVSFIGFRILERGGLQNFYNAYGYNSYDNYEEYKLAIRKGNAHLTMESFDKFFIIPQKDLNVNSDLLDDVEDGSSKRQVSSAFRKMFKNKKTNKFILQSFAKQIA